MEPGRRYPISDRHTISNGRIAATIKENGAELCSLIDGHGRQLLWQAGPAWPRHAPILFPIVGKLRNDRLLYKGKTFPMTQHGFARDQRFTWSAREPKACSLFLQDNEATRSQYPFSFRLDVSYAVENDDLIIVYEITNTDDQIMPASIGAHPAFNWPLVAGMQKESHSIVFSHAETAPVRRLDGGLLRDRPFETPIRGTTLALSEALFAEDAIIMDQLNSSSLRYTAPGAPTIAISWEGFRQLGLWSKPGGASFLCIEPWHGYASPVDFDGDFENKPGLIQFAAGETRSFVQRIGVLPC